MTTRPTIGRPGDVVTCEAGHSIAAVLRAFGGDHIVSGDLFDFADGVERPAPGTQFNQLLCPHCGSPWIRAVPAAPFPIVEIHIGAEWR